MLDQPLDSSIKIIAEVANAHEGEADRARKLVQFAYEAKANAVKFQRFTADELAVPTFEHYALYEKLQMPQSAWADLVTYAQGLNLQVFVDVFGLISAKAMHELGVDGYKVHVADVSNYPLLTFLAQTGKTIILSVGGSIWTETADALNVLKEAGVAQIVLMYGIQSYPTEIEHSFLRKVQNLREKFDLPVGFAGHIAGNSPEALQLPLWAAAAGADFLEVHITQDRAEQGLDYYSSLEPEEFAKMVASIRAFEAALGKRSLSLAEPELKYRIQHKKWLVATQDIEVGERITADNSALKRVNNPPEGSPIGLSSALGRQAAHPIKKHMTIEKRDLKIKVVATLACRAESTRLYGKPLQLVGEQPIIAHLIRQLKQVKKLDEIVLAISEGPSQGVFVNFAQQNGLPYVIGPEKDVLQRLITAGDSVQADVVLRTTTENPYIYWENIDSLIETHIHENADLTVTGKLPLGSFVEIISLTALKTAHKHGEDRHRSELCTLFISENPDVFKIVRIPAPQNLQRPDIRLTVDTPQDLILVRTVWEALNQQRSFIPLQEIVQFLDENPDIAAINSNENTLYLWK